MKKYSFCEIVTASSLTSWHIRKLTSIGQKFGGGADTLALCGAKVLWDIDVDINAHHLSHCCKGCKTKYESRK